MKTKLLQAVFASCLTACITTSAYADKSTWPKKFTITTASTGGSYFQYGEAMTKLITEATGVPGKTEISGGPTQNIALVHTGTATIGMTTLGPARESLDGKSPFAPSLKMNKVCALFPMYETPFTIAVLKSSNIKKIADIPAKSKIGFGPTDSTSDTYFPKMLETLGVNFERRNGSWTELSKQLSDGLINVVAFAAGAPVPALQDLETHADIQLLEFTEVQQQTLTKTFPVSTFTINQSMYHSLEKDSRSVSMWNFTIANCDLDADFVYNLMKTMMEKNDKMVDSYPAAKASTIQNWNKNTFLPFHPGAVRYYEEKGIKIPANLRRT